MEDALVSRLIPLLLLAASLTACEIHEATAPAPPASTERIGTTPVPTAPPSATPTAAPTATPSATPTASSSATPAAPAALIGTWVSPSCGERKYARRITFDDKNGFTASDLVSPCPKGVTCIWSGIVERRGTWSSDGRKVTLEVKGPADTRGAPFPAALELSPGPSEGAACPYQREAAAAH
jgi:hypothetical protein